MPQRLQRKRTKGWRMPPGAIDVTRSGPWGNPFVVTEKVAPGKVVGGSYFAVPTAADAVDCFREYAHMKSGYIAAVRQHLRGRDLVCWCPPGSPCHADVLLELANNE